MSDAVFLRDGDRLIPQLEARAGWYADALHGGPVAGAFARAFELVEAPTEMEVTRLTVDLMRPVPTVPLSIETRVVRAGKRIQVLEGRMEGNGSDVAVASALRLRVAEVPVPSHSRPELPPAPSELPVVTMEPVHEPWFHTRGVELRSAKQSFYVAGPGTAWVRLAMRLVEGEEPTPLQRAAVAADFGNGVGNVLSEDFVFMNADLSIYLHRPPEGEWVGLRSRSDIDHLGYGLAQSVLFDTQGSIGHGLQAIFVDRAESFSSQ